MRSNGTCSVFHGVTISKALHDCAVGADTSPRNQRPGRQDAMSTSTTQLRVVSRPADVRSIPVIARERMRMYGWMCLVLILLVAWILRARDFHFATAFMDESIFVLYGRMFLGHRFEAPLDTPLQWSFGWYLWPAMAATADRVGGLGALRAMS